MSLQSRLQDVITAFGTDVKQHRTWLTGSSSGDLTGLNTTTKASLLEAINEVNNKAAPAAVPATETQSGVAEVATQTETTTGTDDTRMITPLKLAQKLLAWAQPLSANLTTLSEVVSGAFGRTLLESADANAAKASLGLSAVATSGSASDITTGVLPSSVLPPLIINEVYTVASQAEMLALTAERGDVAVRTDLNRWFILATDSPSTLEDWRQITAGGDVLSVAGRTGAVTLNKADVGLSNVDNTSDANKPVSTAQQTALDSKLAKASNLSDLANIATARTNLDVYSRGEIGNPETDLVAIYTTAKA